MRQRKNKVRELLAEIEYMKQSLAAKDKELLRSKEILRAKDEELDRVKKVAKLEPKDINQMAGDRGKIEVLQQIAVNNQLSPSIYSPSGGYQKENDARLMHPFYQNLHVKEQENIPYVLGSNKDTSPSMFDPSSKRSPPTVIQKQPRTAKAQYGANRYGGSRKNDQESFQSLSSVSMNQEISNTTDIKVEDFWPKNQDR